MTDGGFLIKFDDKEIARCYTISFDYDKYEYVVNEKEKQQLPVEIGAITIEVEKA